MTNSGIINAGADLPACIRTSYPVYATKRFEYRLLRQMTDMDANAIVYSTENWQYSIDGKDNEGAPSKGRCIVAQKLSCARMRK